MMQVTHPSLTDSLQQLVLECSERIRKLAWKYSRNPFDFEDMYSLGMEEVCKVVRVAPPEEPIGYLYRSAQNAMIDELKRNRLESRCASLIQEFFLLDRYSCLLLISITL